MITAFYASMNDGKYLKERQVESLFRRGRVLIKKKTEHSSEQTRALQEEAASLPEAESEQAAVLKQEKAPKRKGRKKRDDMQLPEGEPLLRVIGVEREFQVGSRKLHVLKGIDMEVGQKQLVMLRGRSGSGKTTLLNLIGGLDQPTRGEVWFLNQPFHQLGDNARTEIRRTKIGFIFQTYALLPLLSAYENVELALRMSDVPRSEWKDRVTSCLEMVGLGKRMNHRPFEMSGGEQQRVAIAKAIAHRPALILADEPTAELDSQMGAQVMNVLRNIIEQEQISICMTTHDPTILEVADHVYEMVDGRFVSEKAAI